MMLSAVTPAFAVSTDTDAVTATDTEVYFPPDNEEQGGTEPDVIENDEDLFFDPQAPAAKMYLCSSSPYGKYIFGHIWIVIKNTSTRSFYVAGEEVLPGEMISFGLHHFDGLHINDEISVFRGRTVKAEETVLTYEQVGEISLEISSSRWCWYEYFTHNCTNFATTVWRLATGRVMFVFCFPFVVSMQMRNTVSLTIG